MNNYLDLTRKFISFKTVSTNPKFQNEIEKCVLWLQKIFKENNFEVDVVKGYSNPIVIGSYEVDPKFQTVIVYGHYDVQPAEVLEGWNSDPFELTENDEKLVARGIVDNKGQVMIHISNVFDLINSEGLKYNVKFVLEGSEEVGSHGFDKFLTDHKDKLNADFFFISDGSLRENKPTIDAGTRGVVNMLVNLTTSTHEVHSGLYGGIMPNAALEAARLVSKLTLDSNKISFDEFYGNVDEVLIKPEKNLDQLKQNLMKVTGAKELFLQNKNYDYYIQTGLMPSIEITGLSSGYTGDGFRNSVPNTSQIKLNIRIVEKQNPVDVYNMVVEFIKANLPSYVQSEFIKDADADAIKLDTHNKFVEKAQNILQEVFGSEPVINYSGGTLPLLKFVRDILKMPIVSVPLVNEDCNMHGANENFDKKILEKSQSFSLRFFS